MGVVLAKIKKNNDGAVIKSVHQFGLSVLCSAILLVGCGDSGTDAVQRTSPDIISGDVTAPVITLLGESSITLGLGRDYVEQGAIAIDAVDGEIIMDAPSGDVDINKIGSYPLTYRATDNAGNSASEIRMVEVVEARPFVMLWKTETDNQQVSININRNDVDTSITGSDFNVDWGDGVVESHLSDDATHTYAEAGSYEVRISGSLLGLSGCSSPFDSLQSIEQWGDIAFQTFESAFKGCNELVVNDSESPDLRLITNMSSMFYGAAHFNSDMSDWDVSLVSDMSGMFVEASAFNQDISSWDVSSVTTMSGMFFAALAFDQNIGRWDMSSVVDMSAMFLYATLSTDNYDALLNGWSAQEVQSNVTFDAGESVRSDDAEEAFLLLTTGKGWSITDSTPSE